MTATKKSAQKPVIRELTSLRASARDQATRLHKCCCKCPKRID
jgi:hypothetical protein